MVRYHQPVAGIDENGNSVTCDEEIRMSTEDAINVQRYRTRMRYASQNKPFPADHPAQLLSDFIAVHWAETF